MTASVVGVAVGPAFWGNRLGLYSRTLGASVFARRVQWRNTHLGVEQAALCRHRGAPPKAVVAQVVKIVQTIGEDDAYLNSYGLSPEEYRLALPVAVRQMRGRSSASNKERRNFLTLILDHLVSCRAIDRYTMPNYGRETVGQHGRNADRRPPVGRGVPAS